MTLEILTSDLLAPVKHGFFTRKGGASSGVFSGLNCGLGSSDQKQAVVANRERVAKAIGIAPGNLATVHQHHSADVVAIEGPDNALQKADAMVTNQPGIALGVLTADCQPVLFSDPEAGVIGAAHAGWSGALGGVLENTVDAMILLGSTPENIRAVIGPSISQAAYEVGPEFFDRFTEDDPENSRFFAGGLGDRMQFDLPGYGLSRLRAAGVTAEWTRHCTYSDPARFYSYRRSVHQNEPDYGRLIATICL